MLIIADGNNLAWAGFHALRRSMNPQTAGEKTRAALLGLTQSVLGLAIRAGGAPENRAAVADARTDGGGLTGLAVAFDEGRPLMRRSIWPAYQTGRESDPNFAGNEAFILDAIEQFIAFARVLPVTVLRGRDTEADDLVAHLALAVDGPVRIASSDRDFLQLVDERISIYSPIKRLVIDTSNFDDHAAPRTADGQLVVFPRGRYLDFRAASGDASDDLPGIPGLGTVGAARLLAMAPLDDYLANPALTVRALGRQNTKLAAALRDGEAASIVARNRVLMDLRAAAARYSSLDGYAAVGTWDDAAAQAWLQSQRIAGLDTRAALAALDALAAA